MNKYSQASTMHSWTQFILPFDMGLFIYLSFLLIKCLYARPLWMKFWIHRVSIAILLRGQRCHQQLFQDSTAE